ncbi:DUF4179 domain-containing protein [Bacillus horti]|uniref:Zinc-finger domain-containing protein n=1 Tax=Caldalkalibacillus horti TaxID=77523 RepID=A0ABT9W1E7_9BACI|nr:DUF4179 domain-containing protein [Bacillus horti]MDQ0167056.1 hypothetical protein [Bacillus horti]
MKCIPTKRLFLYMDQLQGLNVDQKLREIEASEIKEHLKHCPGCKAMFQRHLNELKVLNLQPSPLPDSFASTVLNKLESHPLKQVEVTGKRFSFLKKHFKAFSVSLSALILLFIASSYSLNGTVYHLLHSSLSGPSTDNDLAVVEELIQTDEAPLFRSIVGDSPTFSIEDQGIVLSIEKVYSDESRIKLYYTLKEEEQEKYASVNHKQEMQLSNHASSIHSIANYGTSNRIYLVDQEGKDLMEFTEINLSDEAGHLALSVIEELPLDTIVRIELSQIGAISGNWLLEVPLTFSEWIVDHD